MSTYNDIDITCENCGEDFKGTIWTAVHAVQDPELKDLLIGGELNMVMCPSCAHVSYQDHFILYQDPPAELVAYVYPEKLKSEETLLRINMMEGYREAQAVYEPNQRKNYDPYLLFGLESLVHLLEEETQRAEQSQVAQELCKLENIPCVILPPSEARRLKTVRVWPTISPEGKAETKDFVAGVEKLLKLNPALDQYTALLERLKTGLTVTSAT